MASYIKKFCVLVIGNGDSCAEYITIEGPVDCNEERGLPVYTTVDFEERTRNNRRVTRRETALFVWTLLVIYATTLAVSPTQVPDGGLNHALNEYHPGIQAERWLGAVRDQSDILLASTPAPRITKRASNYTGPISTRHINFLSV